MATVASDGTVSNINTLIAAATAGDTITVPASTFMWGASGAQIIMNKAVHLTGLGTTINFSGSSLTQTNAIIVMTGNGGWVDGTWTINGLYINPAAVTPISWSGTNFVVTGITYGSSATLGGYFIYVSEGTGVCHNCTITANGPSLQTFMIRGGNSRWNATHTMGTASAVYIEDCTISSDYAQENDGCAASVVRFNTIVSGASLDMHQFETSSSAEGTQHGSRQMEAYKNTYTTAVNGSQWLNARAGTGMVFDNVVPTTGVGGAHYFALVFQYGAQSGVPINGVSGTIATPAQLPIADQLGIGPYVAGVQTAGAEPFYYFNNAMADGSDMPLQGYNPQSSAAISQYGSTFYATSEDGSPYMYLRGREYFRGQIGGSFPSVSDVGRGTKASMNASSPTAAGQAWWVTDEGSWNTNLAANTSGRLYKWSGSAWALFYTPYTYPHPLRSGGVTTPTLSAATINSAGTTLTLTLSESCTTGAGGSGGVVLTCTGGASVATYSSGSASVSYVFSLGRTIQQGETITVTYTQPGNGIEATSSGTDLATFSGSSVTNNSTIVTNVGGTILGGKTTSLLKF